jgi:hypothetical protein
MILCGGCSTGVPNSPAATPTPEMQAPNLDRVQVPAAEKEKLPAARELSLMGRAGIEPATR